jgi:SAM-dependent methyltransferase
MSGFEDELDFWSATLASDADVGEEHRRRLEVRELEPWFRELVPPNVNPVRILDVGSGPLTTLGSRLPGRALEVVAVDPLADAYNELLDGLGLEPPVRPVAGRVEALADAFPPDCFDLVHAANSLDHCLDPITGVEQMLTVLKPGGTLWLLHLKDVAEAHQYEGLHQWSLRPVDEDDMEIWNRDHSVRLSELAGRNPFSVIDHGETFVVRLTKTPR